MPPLQLNAKLLFRKTSNKEQPSLKLHLEFPQFL